MTKNPNNREILLVEIEDLLRTMPSREAITNDFNWLGRAAAAIGAWNYLSEPIFSASILRLHQPFGSDTAFREVMVTLHHAHSALRIETTGPTNIAIGSGRVFEYFDEIRKVIELATTDVFFVDPYLNAEFVSRYLPLPATARDGAEGAERTTTGCRDVRP